MPFSKRIIILLCIFFRRICNPFASPAPTWSSCSNVSGSQILSEDVLSDRYRYLNQKANPRLKQTPQRFYQYYLLKMMMMFLNLFIFCLTRLTILFPKVIKITGLLYIPPVYVATSRFLAICV